VVEELKRATEKFGKFNSMHEGYAVIKEELEELWEEIKKQPRRGKYADLKMEATQLAAVAIRFLYDFCD